MTLIAAPEADIVANVLIAITARPHAMFIRQNVGVATHAGRTVRFGRKGMPDIGGCYRGWAVGFECKTVIGRQRPAQIVWQQSWERAGGIYAIVRDPTDAIAVLDRLDNGPPGPLHGNAEPVAMIRTALAMHDMGMSTETLRTIKRALAMLDPGA